MITWKSVDLPEPVLPAKSACWRVPLPMARYWSFVAPVRPIAIRSSLVVSFVHISSSAGAICANGTSTRFESMLLRPIPWTSSMASSGAGGGSNARASPTSMPSLEKTHPSRIPRRHTLLFCSSSGTKPSGSGWRRSRWISVKTPQRAPLVAMLWRRFAAVSLKFAGKSATTRKWYFSATLSACALYSVIVAYSLRRYIWMTFSMCSFSSASRSSIWSRWVQMRWLISEAS